MVMATAWAVAIAVSASAQLAPVAQRSYGDFQRQGPHRAFVLAADGKGYWWALSNGANPGRAVVSATKECEERSRGKCSVYAVNNIVLNGRDWKEAAPPALPPIGRLRPEPYWSNKGPQAATGLIVWSHGYMAMRPEGFSGHGAANGPAFPRKFGACIDAFIETGARQPPCVQ